MRLDPTERELRALLVRLHNHTQVKTSTLLRETGAVKTYINERPCKHEVPIAGCRYTLNGHDLAFTHASHDRTPHHAASRLAVTVLTVIPRRKPQDLFRLVRLHDWVASKIAISDTLDQRVVGVLHGRRGRP